MTEDNIDKLKELEETVGRKSEGESGKNASTEGSSDSDKTQEMPLSMLQEKLEQERLQRLATEGKPLDELAMEGGDIQGEESPLQVTEADMPVQEERLIEEDLFMPGRPGVSPMTRGIVLVIIVLMTVMLYFMFRSMKKTPATPVPPAAPEKEEVVLSEETVPTKTPITTTIPVKPEEEVPPPPVFELSGDIFQGIAPRQVKEKGPVISEESDPEITAVANALTTRIEILSGSKTTTRGGVETKIISGYIQRFRIVSTLQKKGGQVIRDDISITTPSRGLILIKNNILDSVRNMDYEKFIKELETAGITVVKIPETNEETVKVQLKMTKFNGVPASPEYIIGENSVGGVEIGMPIGNLESVLPANKYVVVAKKVEHENKYYNTFKVYDKRNKSLFFVNEKDKQVWGIQIVSNLYKTAKGIGIGSRLGELRINYLDNSPVKITTTAGGLPFVSVGEIKGIFILQAKGLSFETQEFPHETRITDILLGGSPFIK